MTIGRAAGGTVWNIQILRFVAAAMVLFGHLQHEVTQRPAMADGFQAVDLVWWAGGVDIFFVISGFIMYHIAGHEFGAPGAARKFVVRRLIRLVPPYWAFTLVALAVMALLPAQMAMNSSSLGHILASFAFLPWPNPAGDYFPVLVLGWTLNYEMLFYAIFALGLLFARRIGLPLIAALLLVLAAGQMFDWWRDDWPLGAWRNTMMIEFLFGIGIAMLHERGVRLGVAGAWIVIAAGLGSLIAMPLFGWAGGDWTWRFLWAGGPALLLVAGGALIRDEGRPGPVRRLFVFGGDTSYALYLSHPFVLSAAAMAAAAIGMDDAWTYIIIAGAACLLAAAAWFVIVERPTYRWLTRAYERRWPSRSSARTVGVTARS
ncbi:acyltransferase [Sphingomonas sp. 1P06PA]|uniref:acyltransferase family protein n=1 Tax=Sphingomonas sp. 1P06PA TaxID=554121 RepID=UPI0039A77C51